MIDDLIFSRIYGKTFGDIVTQNPLIIEGGWPCLCFIIDMIGRVVDFGGSDMQVHGYFPYVAELFIFPLKKVNFSITFVIFNFLLFCCIYDLLLTFVLLFIGFVVVEILVPGRIILNEDIIDHNTFQMSIWYSNYIGFDYMGTIIFSMLMR